LCNQPHYKKGPPQCEIIDFIEVLLERGMVSDWRPRAWQSWFSHFSCIYTDDHERIRRAVARTQEEQLALDPVDQSNRMRMSF